MPENITEYRYAPLEWREEEPANDDFLGAVIGGPVLNYGDVATLPWGKERFEPGAFGDLSKLTLIANRMHERPLPIGRTGSNLVYTDSPERLSAEIKLLNTTAGRDTLVDVRQGILQGQSVEFRATKERDEDGTRIISAAGLGGHGVVDRPAYPQSTVGQRGIPQSWEEYRAAMEYRNGIFEPQPLRLAPDQDLLAQFESLVLRAIRAAGVVPPLVPDPTPAPAPEPEPTPTPALRWLEA